MAVMGSAGFAPNPLAPKATDKVQFPGAQYDPSSGTISPYPGGAVTHQEAYGTPLNGTRPWGNQDPEQFLAGMVKQFQVMGQPQLDLYDLQNQQLARQMAGQGALRGLDEQSLRAQYGFGQQDLALNRQGIGIDQAYLGQLSGFNQRDYDLALQLLGLDTKEARAQAGIQKRGMFSDATARGAVTAPGLRRGLTDLKHSLARQLQGIDVRRGQAKLGFEREGARIGHEGQGLGLAAQRLGVDEGRLASTFNLGLQRLGLEGVIDAATLFDSISSNNMQKAAAANNILSEAMSLIPPELWGEINTDELMALLNRKTYPSGGGGGGVHHQI